MPHFTQKRAPAGMSAAHEVQVEGSDTRLLLEASEPESSRDREGGGPMPSCHTAPMETIPRRTTDVDMRTVARTVGAARVAIGSAMVVLPGLTTRGWLGADAQRPATKAVVRAAGVRDALLGLGTIRALEQDDEVRPWVLAGAAADGIDALGTVLAWRHLPRRRRFLALTFMAGAAAAGVYLAGQVDEG